MGFDKQTLRIGDVQITYRLIKLLQTRFHDVMVASSASQLYSGQKVRVIEDVYKDAGPLGGIHSALLKSQSQAVFTIACDMPFLDIPYIDYMVSVMRGKKYDACVTGRQGYYEIFHSFYCKSCIPVLEDDLNQNKNSVNRFVGKINALVIPEQVASVYLPGWKAFTNLNTKEEYERFCNTHTQY